MATVYADECCMCPPELGCLGIFCPKRSRRVHVCNICGETITEDDPVSGEYGEDLRVGIGSDSFAEHSYFHTDNTAGGDRPANGGYQVGTSHTADRELCAECARRVNI